MGGWEGSEESGQIFEMEFVSSLCESIRYREVLTTYTYLTPTFFYSIFGKGQTCVYKNGIRSRRQKNEIEIEMYESALSNTCMRQISLLIYSICFFFSSALRRKSMCSFRKRLKIVCLIFLCCSVSESSFDKRNIYIHIYFFFLTLCIFSIS